MVTCGAAFAGTAFLAGAAAFLAAAADFLTGGISISFEIVRDGNLIARFGSDNEADMSFPRFGVTFFRAIELLQAIDLNRWGHKAFNQSMRGRPVNSMDTCLWFP